MNEINRLRQATPTLAAIFASIYLLLTCQVAIADEKPFVTESVSNQATTYYVESNGINYAYRKFGRESELPLVLFHRFRGTMDHWDPKFLDKLAETRTVIIFDNRGVAKSSGVTASSIDGMGQAASDFINALDYPKVDVLGWSMGGFIVQQMALDRPGTINKVIVAGSGPGGVAEAPPMSEKVLRVLQNPGTQNPKDIFLFLFFSESETSRLAGIQHLGRLGARNEDFGPEVTAETVTAQATAFRAWTMGKGSAYDRLESLKHPILVANGQQDIMIDAYNAFAMTQRVPNAKLVLYPDSGHGFLFQYIDEFVAEIDNFLN